MEQGSLFDIMSMDSLMEQAEEEIRGVDLEETPITQMPIEEPKIEEPKKEEKVETKEEPKKEVVNEIKEEPVKDTKQEVKEEPKKEVKKEVKKETKEEITVEDVKNQEKDKPKPKKKASKKTVTSTQQAKAETKSSVDDLRFNGALRVVVYGEELFTVNDNTVSLEDIRDRLVTEYHFTEFKDKNTCTMIVDTQTGIVKPHIEFMKKG